MFYSILTLWIEEQVSNVDTPKLLLIFTCQFVSNILFFFEGLCLISMFVRVLHIDKYFVTIKYWSLRQLWFKPRMFIVKLKSSLLIMLVSKLDGIVNYVPACVSA